MKKIILIYILALTLNEAFGQEEGKFTIIGNIKGLSDKAILYLEYTDEEEKLIDSTSIINGEFLFNGKLKSKAVNALIRTSNFTYYKFFWLENSIVTFNAEKEKFIDAQITGSNTQIEQDKLNKVLNTVSEKEQIKAEQKFVKENPNSIVSAHILNVYSSTWGKEMTTILYNNLSEELKKSTYGKSISNFIYLNRSVKSGDKYVDFSQNDTQNKKVNLSDLDGKVILLEFWGSWCDPCRQTNPELVKIYNEFKDKGFEIFGVAAETNKDAWLQAIEKDKLSWTNVTDLKGDKNEASLIYGVSGYPTNFLIDKSGVIIARELNIKQLRKQLKELLDK
ncbi:MAG: redoxin domain-containing protein [Saprospiraceae bacterium]